MSTWPLDIALSRGTVQIGQPGRYALVIREENDLIEQLADEVLASARARLGVGVVGWMPEDGGLLSNLPAWENVLLSTQWHAPASLPALEKRVRGWCGQLGYDTKALAAMLARPPAFLDEDDRRLVGWLRQLLSRPRLVVLRAGALPGGETGAALSSLLNDELAGAALLVVDEFAPDGYESLTLSQPGS